MGHFQAHCRAVRNNHAVDNDYYTDTYHDSHAYEYDYDDNQYVYGASGYTPGSNVDDLCDDVLNVLMCTVCTESDDRKTRNCIYFSKTFGDRCNSIHKQRGS